MLHHSRGFGGGIIAAGFSVSLLTLALMTCTGQVLAQAPETPEVAEFKDPTSLLWVNTYGNFRIKDRFFWIAETHFRFQEDDDTPHAGQIAQLYNRHAISYLYSKYFQACLGGVLRVNFNTNDVLAEGEESVVPEYRIWHQYQFAQPLSRLMIYHRLRIEHRWTRGFAEDSEYIFRNRWRYMLRAKIPLNSSKLGVGTIYASPECELIMQSGKPVVGSPLEDLRLTGTIGYVLSPRLTLAGGFMHSLGQDLRKPNVYKQKATIRLHAYYNLDLRKVKNRLPEIHQDE